MTFDDFITYLSVELPKGYVLKKRKEGKEVVVYNSKKEERGIILAPEEMTLTLLGESGISATAKILVRAFERAETEMNIAKRNRPRSKKDLG